MRKKKQTSNPLSVQEMDKRKESGLLEKVYGEYTYLKVIGKIRSGTSIGVVADLCCTTKEELAQKLKNKGYSEKGVPLHTDVVNFNNKDYTPITEEIIELLKEGLKKGYDTDYLIDEYHLNRKVASGYILKLRRSMRESAKKLIPLEEMKYPQDTYKTIYTVTIKDLEHE